VETEVAAATGGVLSIFIVTELEVDTPEPFFAEHVSVTEAVSLARVVVVQAVEEAMPDSGSVTLQVTVTLLRYHPLLPSVPVIWGMMTGGVVSGNGTPFILITVTPPVPLPGSGDNRLLSLATPPEVPV